MSSTATPASPPRKRSFFRSWLPWIIVALGGAGIGVLWGVPPPHVEGASRVAGSIGIGFLTLLLLGFWFLFFSGLRWWVRLGIPVLVRAGFFGFMSGAVKRVAFSGDMVPHFHFNWEKSHEDILNEHRARQKDAAAALPPTDLAGADSFPAYRGEQRDGVVHGPTLAREWKAP